MKKYLLIILTLVTVGLNPIWSQANPDSKQPLVNISTRTTISPHNPQVVVGFTVPANPDPTLKLYPKNLLLRAIGSGLTQFGVANALPDPVVKVFNAQGMEVSSGWTHNFTQLLNSADANDSAESRAAIADSVAQAATHVGAFPVPVPTLDNVTVADYSLVVGLIAGNYTAVVTSASGGSGDVLVEIYSLHN